MVLVSHAVFAATLCSPVSWDVLLAYTLLLQISLVRLVQPMDNYESEAAQAAMSDAEGARPMVGGMAAQVCTVSVNMYKHVQTGNV